MKVYQNPRYHEYRWRTWLEPLIPKDGNDRHFLDLGCNAGFYMEKARNMGYDPVGVEIDEEYICQAPKELNITRRDINFYDPSITYLTLAACIHYHQTEEQVEALFRTLRYSTLYLIVMGRNKRHEGEVCTSPTREDLMKKMGSWEEVQKITDGRFYTVLFKNPRYEEFDVDGLYLSTRKFLTTVPNFLDYVPAFEEFTRKVINGEEFDVTKCPLMDYFKQRRLMYPLGRCWVYKKLIWDIQKNGLSQALVVEGDRIKDGMHRLIILRELGIKRVICKVGT